MILHQKKIRRFYENRKKFILIFFCTILIFIGFGEKTFAQGHLNKRVTLTVNNEQISTVIKQLQLLVNFNIIYYLPNNTNDTRQISFSATNETLKQLFAAHFATIGIYYKDYSQAILLYRGSNGTPPNTEINKITRLYKLTPEDTGPVYHNH